MGASLLALAKSIYYRKILQSKFKGTTAGFISDGLWRLLILFPSDVIIASFALP